MTAAYNWYSRVLVVIRRLLWIYIYINYIFFGKAHNPQCFRKNRFFSPKITNIYSLLNIQSDESKYTPKIII